MISFLLNFVLINFIAFTWCKKINRVKKKVQLLDAEVRSDYNEINRSIAELHNAVIKRIEEIEGKIK